MKTDDEQTTGPETGGNPNRKFTGVARMNLISHQVESLREELASLRDGFKAGTVKKGEYLDQLVEASDAHVMPHAPEGWPYQKVLWTAHFEQLRNLWFQEGLGVYNALNGITPQATAKKKPTKKR